MKIAFVLLAAVALLGCTTPRQAARSLDDRLGRIRVGMTRDQVVKLIGQPKHVNTTITAGTRREQWIYTEATLASNCMSAGEEFFYGMARGAAGGSLDSSYWYFYFENGVLTTMQQRH